MRPQRGDRLDLLVEHAADLGKPEPQLAQDEDPLQAQQARAVVEPLPAMAGAARGEQAHLLVVAQGAAGDAGAADDLLDRPLPGWVLG